MSDHIQKIQHGRIAMQWQLGNERYGDTRTPPLSQCKQNKADKHSRIQCHCHKQLVIPHSFPSPSHPLDTGSLMFHRFLLKIF